MTIGGVANGQTTSRYHNVLPSGAHVRQQLTEMRTMVVIDFTSRWYNQLRLREHVYAGHAILGALEVLLKNSQVGAL